MELEQVVADLHAHAPAVSCGIRGPEFLLDLVLDFEAREGFVCDLALLHDFPLEFTAYTSVVVVDVSLEIFVDKLLGQLRPELLKEVLPKTLTGLDTGLNGLYGTPIGVVVFSREIKHKLGLCRDLHGLELLVSQAEATLVLLWPESDDH